MAVKRNTSTLNGTFTCDRRFISSVVSADARSRENIAETRGREWLHGTAVQVLSVEWLEYLMA